MESGDEKGQRDRCRTGLVWHELFMWHDTSPLAGFLQSGRGVLEPDEPTESPATKRRIKNLLDVSGITDRLLAIKPRAATEDELALVHDRAYIGAVQAMSAIAGGDARMSERLGETPFGPGGYEIAALAAGGVIEAVNKIMACEARNAYALVRPPGHHAEVAHGFGFCIFNNAAIAARHAQRAHGLERIAIVDWDVHHGNGAQHIFWEDPSVLTVSIHQDSAFPPGSGALTDIGEGPGEGFNLNVPLPPGSGVGAYMHAVERVIVPALHAFRPEFIMVASGFDAGCFDPMSRMMLHSGCFREMTRLVQAAADDLCTGRLTLCHEGGYHKTSTPFMGLAVIEELSGGRSQIDDPFLPIIEKYPFQALQPHQNAIIAEAEGQLARLRRSTAYRKYQH